MLAAWPISHIIGFTSNKDEFTQNTNYQKSHIYSFAKTYGTSEVIKFKTSFHRKEIEVHIGQALRYNQGQLRNKLRGQFIVA